MADVVFLLDDSQHMLELNSKKVKQFVKDIVVNFNIGENKMRVGSVSFSSWIENNFYLNRHYTLANLLHAIDNIKRRKRTSFIDCAFDYLRTHSFTIANGDRAEIPNIVIIVTDGKPDSEAQTLKAANALKDSGIIVFVVAVGRNIQTSDLTFLASDPSSEFVYRIDNFDDFNKIKSKISKRICKGLYPNAKQNKQFIFIYCSFDVSLIRFYYSTAENKYFVFLILDVILHTRGTGNVSGYIIVYS